MNRLPPIAQSDITLHAPLADKRRRLAAQLVRARAMLSTAEDARSRAYLSNLVQDIETRLAALDARAAAPAGANQPAGRAPSAS